MSLAYCWLIETQRQIEGILLISLRLFHDGSSIKCQLNQVKLQVFLQLTFPVISLKPPDRAIEVSSWLCSRQAKTLTMIDNISSLRSQRCQSMCDDRKENSERDIVELHCCGIEPGRVQYENQRIDSYSFYTTMGQIPAAIHICRHRSKIRS